MSLPQKGSRSIEIDGARYRWLIRRKPTYGQGIGESGLSVAIELLDHGATLVVVLDAHRPDAWIDPGQVSVTPRDVARFVRAGLARGWTPALAGKTVELRSSEVP
jgi:hypothetical protein